MDCDAIRRDLDAYALGALDTAEVETVAAHLAGCSSCRRELAALEAAASALPSALAASSPLRPPNRIKERLLARISVEEDAGLPRTEPISVSSPSPSSPNHAGVGYPLAEAVRPTAATAVPAALWHRPWAWGGVAAAILLAASFAWSVRLSEALDREREMRQAVAGFYSAQQAIVFEVVDAETTDKRVLLPPAGSDFPTRPYGKVFTRADMNHVVAMANRLPVASAGETYHLWVTLDGRIRHAGVLTPNEEGFAVLVFDADRPGPAYSAAWITRQPADATEPDGATIVVWDANGEA